MKKQLTQRDYELAALTQAGVGGQGQGSWSFRDGLEAPIQETLNDGSTIRTGQLHMLVRDTGIPAYIWSFDGPYTGGNLIPNGDFATNTYAFWNVILANVAGYGSWASSASTGAAVITLTLTAAMNNVEVVCSIASAYVKVHAGIEYNVQATIGGNYQNGLNIYWYNSSLAQIGVDSYPGGGTVDIKVMAPVGAAYAFVYVYGSITNPGVGTYSLLTADNIAMVPLSVHYDLSLSPQLEYSEGLWPQTLRLSFRQFRMFLDDGTNVSANMALTVIAGPVGYYHVGPLVANSHNGDYYTVDIVLGAGTYTLYIPGVASVNFAKMNVYIDNQKITATIMDWYASATDYVVEKSASFTLDVSGRHELKFVVEGKNASSTGYRLLFNEIFIYKT